MPSKLSDWQVAWDKIPELMNIKIDGTSTNSEILAYKKANIDVGWWDADSSLGVDIEDLVLKD